MNTPTRPASSTVTLPSLPFDDDATLPTASDGEIYALVRRAGIDPGDVEEIGTRAVEVSVLWQSAILHVAHLTEGEDFALATSGRVGDRTTLVVDESMLPAGVTRRIVVRPDARGARFVFAPGAGNEVEASDGTRSTPASLMDAGLAEREGDAVACAMKDDTRYRTHVGSLTILARIVARPRRIVATRPRDKRFLAIGLGALALVAGLAGTIQFAPSDDGTMLSSDDTEARLADLRDFMARQAEHTPPPATGANEGAAAPELAAAGAQGRAGRADEPQRTGSIQVARHLPHPVSGRPMTVAEVGQSGILGLVGDAHVAVGSSGAPSIWQGITASGDAAQDTTGVDGNGNGLGWGGLGRVGTGVGNDGQNDRATLVGGLHTGGGCTAGNDCGRFGGSLTGTHLGNGREHPPVLRAAPPTVVGINADVIRRVVLRNIGQVSHCHEQGLAVDPNLAGRVVVRFVIAPGGAVLGSNVAETSVHLASVNECIASAVRRWTFAVPSDQAAPVTVNYPFVLSPAQ